MSVRSCNADLPRSWRLKRRLLQDPIALAAPLRTELGNRPHTQVILRPRTTSGTQKTLMWLLAVLVSLFVGDAMAERLWNVALIAGVIGALGALATWIAYRRAAMSLVATWHRDRVVVQDSRYGRTRIWEERLAAFHGVARKDAYLRQGSGLTPNLRVYGVILAHRAPLRSLLLHAERRPIPDDVLTDYARQLGTEVVS